MGRTMVVLASSPPPCYSLDIFSVAPSSTPWIFKHYVCFICFFSQFFCMALKRPMAEWSINVIIVIILPLLSLLLLLLLLPYD